MTTQTPPPADLMALTDRAINTAITTLVVSCRPAGNVDVDDAAEIRGAVALLRQARESLAVPRARPSLSAQAVGDGWLPIESAPEGKKVLLAIEYPSGRKNVIRAMLAGHKTLPLSDEQDSWEGCFYDEEEDQTYCAPGWYESNENEETNWHVSDKAVGWQPLPPAPGTTPPQPADGGDRVGDAERNAARYLFLRDKIGFSGNGDGTSSMFAINLPMRVAGFPAIGEHAEFIDAALDAALAKFQPAGGES